MKSPSHCTCCKKKLIFQIFQLICVHDASFCIDGARDAKLSLHYRIFSEIGGIVARTPLLTKASALYEAVHPRKIYCHGLSQRPSAYAHLWLVCAIIPCTRHLIKNSRTSSRAETAFFSKKRPSVL